jgi:DNA-binding transcriptional MerR regulator
MYKRKLYYKIGEVCEITGLKPSIIRFWEKEFRQLRPVKFGSNHRYYTTKHIDTLLTIKELLYKEKMTIEGARQRLETENCSLQNNKEVSVSEIKAELTSILNKLKN